MKTKFYLTSLALAAMVAGCANEDFIAEPSAKLPNGLVEIGDNFMVAAVDASAETRTHWGIVEVNGQKVLRNQYLPTWAVSAPTSGNAIEGQVTPDEIGLCWTGVAADGTGSVSDKVYSNYQFYHFGWLGKDQTAPAFDACAETPTLNNGWLYNELGSEESSVKVGDEIDGSKLKAITAGGLSSETKTYNNKILKREEMDFNSGVYKTENKAIFGGDYIAYYPYNKDFKDAGCIPATSPVVFDNVLVGNEGIEDPQIGKATFRYAYAKGIVGGAGASGFEFSNLSGLIRVYLQTDGAANTSVKIDKVTLFSAAAAFKKEVTLSASAIAAKKTGTALYASTVATSQTILANIDENATLNLGEKDKKQMFVTVTALPTTITDLKVLVHDGTSNKWAEATIGQHVVEAGALKSITVTLKADGSDFKQVYYAVDHATLNEALTQAESAANVNSPKTVKVLGDITLDAGETTMPEVPAYVTVEGDKIIVPEGTTLTLKTSSTVKSAIDVLGQTCCGGDLAAGKLEVEAATIAGAVKVFSGYPNRDGGAINFVDTQKAKAWIAKTGSLVLEEGTTATVAGGADVNTRAAAITNAGTFEVENNGSFAVLDETGATTAAAGAKFVNNGTFIDNVSAVVGGATQYMTNNAEYICKVASQDRLNEAYLQKPACTTIDIVEALANYTAYVLDQATKHNNKDVNILVSGGKEGGNVRLTAKEKAVTIGDLTVTGYAYISETPAIKDKDGKTIGYATVSVNGDINVLNFFQTAENVKGMTAKNMYVGTDWSEATAKFANRSNVNDVTLAVAGTVQVAKKGTFNIVSAEGGKNIALITCKKLVEGGTFTNGKPEVVR